MTPNSSRTVVEQDIPSDIVLRAGFAPSLPNSWFLYLGYTEVGPVTRITLDPPVRHLLDVVAELVAPCTARSAADDARFNLALEAPWGQVQQKGFMHPFNDSRRSRRGSDDPDEIERLLEQLVARPENDCSAFFRVGRKIGRILADCHRYENNLIEPLDGDALDFGDDGDEDEAFKAAYLRDLSIDSQRQLQRERDDDGFLTYTAHGWRVSLRESLQDLLEDPLAGDFSNAANWLATEEANLDEHYAADDLPAEFRKLAAVRGAAWLAFGEMLHAAHCADQGRHGSERPQTPRMLKIAPLTEKSSKDDIRNQLILLENAFDGGSVYLSPKLIVEALVNSVEALAKRVWRIEGPTANVVGVLSERLKNGNDEERRFASVALTLYKSYRNQAVHAFDKFQCTWLEALYFFNGIRVLLEWSEAMGQSASGPSKRLPP